MAEIESMESMEKRLAGTGGGSQATAVRSAIMEISGAPGMLDKENRAVALYHLAVALSGESRAAESLRNSAELKG